MLNKQLTSKSYKATHEGWDLNITENIGGGVGVLVEGHDGDNGSVRIEISNKHLTVHMNPFNVEVVSFLVNHFTESEGSDE